MDVAGYTRVSRKAGRSGDSFISPEEQRRAIERLAESKRLDVAEWFEELDESGGNSDRPRWLEVRDRIARGELRGVVVLNFSRWARDTEAGVASVKAIRSAGGDIWSVQEDFDTTTPEGWYMLTNFFAMAQLFREQAARSFRRARASAIERGVWCAQRVPFGYIRDETRHLVADPEAAPVVVEAFRMRASGRSWNDIARFLIGKGGRPTLNGSSARYLVTNRAYLGEARSGDLVNPKAHPPIVS